MESRSRGVLCHEDLALARRDGLGAVNSRLG